MREELINKLTDIISHQTGWTHAVDCASVDVAYFILAREQKMLDEIEKPLKHADERMSVVDCGDNSCLFKKPKTGMRTNGGCRCYQNGTWNTESRIALQAMPQAIRLALAKIRELRGEKNG